MAERQDPSTSGMNTAGERDYRAQRRPVAAPTGGGRGMAVSIVLAVLLVGLLAAGWFILNQKALLDQQNTMLVDADARIKVLEDRLRLTDETLTETGDQTQEKITFWESEIRKLWAVVNDRNKRLIDQNTASIAKAQKTAAALEAGLRQQGVQVDRHEQGMAKVQQLTDQLAGMELQFQQVIDSQRDLVEKFNAQQKGLTAMRDDLTSRVTETEQAISAIDAFRAQMNNRFNELERRVAAPPLN